MLFRVAKSPGQIPLLPTCSLHDLGNSLVRQGDLVRSKGPCRLIYLGHLLKRLGVGMAVKRLTQFPLEELSNTTDQRADARKISSDGHHQTPSAKPKNATPNRRQPTLSMELPLKCY